SPGPRRIRNAMSCRDSGAVTSRKSKTPIRKTRKFWSRGSNSVTNRRHGDGSRSSPRLSSAASQIRRELNAEPDHHQPRAGQAGQRTDQPGDAADPVNDEDQGPLSYAFE